ncbi:MAG: hypothetical protein DRJ43_06410 [Thermoprotei archaeon]|nr:MAG: hypothetical protein DRJ43_06410 [Thermoprotei archaeon]
MSLPKILKEVKNEIEECKEILDKLNELEKEIEQLNKVNDHLEREIKRMKEFLFYLLFADFPSIKTKQFRLTILRKDQRAVFTNMTSRLWDLYHTSLSEFLKEVVKLIKERFMKEQANLLKQLERAKEEHLKLKETYDLLKGLRVLMKAGSKSK